MNKVFCVNCGQKNTYGTVKPKFCAGCGTPMGEVTTAKTEDKEEEESSSLDIQATKLDFEIQREGRIKLDDLIREKREDYPTDTRSSRR